MTKQKVLAGFTILVIGTLLLTACGGPQATPAVPTVDANAIYTQAAQTVEANMAQNPAVVQPTETAAPTAAPTNTMDPTNVFAMTATMKAVQPGSATTPDGSQTPAAGQPTATKATTKLTLPTATKAVVAAPPKTTGDKAELNSQSPKDGFKIQKNASFDMHIVLKNTGTTTWSTKYTLVFYAGDQMGSPSDFNMPNEVKPGEMVTLVFTMTAPDSTGKKKTIWAMRNADGANFYDMWLDSEVTE